MWQPILSSYFAPDVAPVCRWEGHDKDRSRRFCKIVERNKGVTAKFNQFDMDRSRTIEVEELRLALLSFNFAIPDAVLQMLVSKYDMTGSSRSIQFDNFLECGFIVKGLTEKFRDQDQLRVGSSTFDYTSFMLMSFLLLLPDEISGLCLPFPSVNYIDTWPPI